MSTLFDAEEVRSASAGAGKPEPERTEGASPSSGGAPKRRAAKAGDELVLARDVPTLGGEIKRGERVTVLHVYGVEGHRKVTVQLTSRPGRLCAMPLRDFRWPRGAQDEQG